MINLEITLRYTPRKTPDGKFWRAWDTEQGGYQGNATASKDECWAICRNLNKERGWYR